MLKKRDTEIQELRYALNKALHRHESVTKNIAELNQLQGDLDAKHFTINSMESTQKTTDELLAVKNVVIECQQQIIDVMKSNCDRNCASNVMKLRKKIEEQEVEIKLHKANFERAQTEYEKLLLQVQTERELLTSKLQNHLSITKKTEFAIQKLENLVESKNIINTALKNLIKTARSEFENLTSLNKSQENDMITSVIRPGENSPRGLCETARNPRDISLHDDDERENT